MDNVLVEGIFQSLECNDDLTREFIAQVIADIQLFDKKQQDYGSRNISDWGEFGVLVRVNDKVARLKNLHSVSGGIDVHKMPANESLDDSWADLSVYGVIARMVRAGKWPNDS